MIDNRRPHLKLIINHDFQEPEPKPELIGNVPIDRQKIRREASIIHGRLFRQHARKPRLLKSTFQFQANFDRYARPKIVSQNGNQVVEYDGWLLNLILTPGLNLTDKRQYQSHFLLTQLVHNFIEASPSAQTEQAKNKVGYDAWSHQVSLWRIASGLALKQLFIRQEPRSLAADHLKQTSLAIPEQYPEFNINLNSLDHPAMQPASGHSASNTKLENMFITPPHVVGTLLPLDISQYKL